MDTIGNKAARDAISQIKVAVPNMASRVIDRAIQMHGAAGIGQDFPLAAWTGQRTLRRLSGGRSASSGNRAQSWRSINSSARGIAYCGNRMVPIFACRK